MGAQMRLLTVLMALCTFAPGCCSEECSGFKHLENGRTFFRYGGLLVIFSCHHGYKLHGYKTNSCVSGHWSRDPPVCVGSGCSSPGPLPHGTSSMNDDGSWAVFSCNSGFRLHGPSMLYCKSRTWNSSKPLCRESDIMSSVSGVHVQKANTHLNNQDAVVLKNLQQSHYDTHTSTASKEVNLKFGLLSLIPFQTSNRERTKTTSSKVHLQLHHQYPDATFKDGTSTGPETGTRRGSEDKLLLEEGVERVTQVTQTLLTPVTQVAYKSHLSAAVSSTVSLVSASTPPPLSTAHTSATTAVKNTSPTENGMFAPTSPLHRAISARPLSSGEKVLRFGAQGNVTPSGSSAGEDQQAQTSVQQPSLSLSDSVGEEEPAETSLNIPSTSSYSISPNSSSRPSVHLPMIPASTPPSFATSNTKEQQPDFNLPSYTSTPTEQKPGWTDHNDAIINATVTPTLLSLSPSRRPVCPYPPVPAHGTFYFRNVENPGPREYKHYIQYACYPGYTLAHGDIHSYCQQGGTWTGVTPVCMELTPCSLDNGGCSQLCSVYQHYDQSSNQTQTRTQCHCRPGFTLLDDGRTCRDFDECAEGRHRCQQRCVNTFGSFKCGCDDGYQQADDQTSCTDVDECLEPAAVTGCVFRCVNTPGSFRCQCPAGYSMVTAEIHCQDIDECAVNQGLGPCMEQCHNSPGSYRCSCTRGHILAGDGHDCIAECPPGYRKQPTTPENSTSQYYREECVDINECQEETCEWQCVNLPGSHRCICPRGYTLHREGRRCMDINECSRKNGGCSHLCVNLRGGYKCACPASHRLSPYSWKKCLPRTTANPAG